MLLMVGEEVGFAVGLAVGFLVGLAVGLAVGFLAGLAVGILLVGFFDVGLEVGGGVGVLGALVHSPRVDTWFHIMALTQRGSKDTTPSPARRGELL
jgi:hypothetical protein